MGDGAPQRTLPRLSTIELATIGVLTLLGLRLGLRAITDNSMLLHLRTGIDIIASGHIPRHDPYTFSAPGHAWVVQSWLAEVSYGAAHWLAGYRGVVFEQGVLMALLAFITAVLARTGKATGTLIAAGVSVIGGAVLWASRPFMFGLLGIALLLFVVERRRSPWWLVPLMWVWVNSHGSFPLGAAWLAARYIGAACDQRRRPRWLEPYALAFGVGLAASMLNPLGPRLLAFPLVVQSRHAVFQLIVEWRSPNFQLGYAFVTLVALSIGLLVVLRRGAPWGDVLPLVGFLGAGLISERNLPFAAVVIAPILARALSSPVAAPADNGPQTPFGGRNGLPPPVVPALAIVAIVLLVQAGRAAPLDLSGYPQAGERYLARAGLLGPGHRIATRDVDGNYRELVEGPRRSVFIDDRYDMFPVAVVDDSQTIAVGQGSALDALKRWNIDVVVWKRGQGPTTLLHAVGGWRTAWSDAKWEILVR
ncbi:MAG: hypothetical protein ACYDH6_03410 [Acidimicrobiales bacterium]